MQKSGEEVEILLDVPATANCAPIVGAGYLAVLERRGMSRPEVRQFREIAEQLVNVMLDEKTVNLDEKTVNGSHVQDSHTRHSDSHTRHAQYPFRELDTTYLNVRFWFYRECPPLPSSPKLSASSPKLNVSAECVYLDITRSDKWLVATESVLMMNKTIHRTIGKHNIGEHNVVKHVDNAENTVKHVDNTHDCSVSGSTIKAEVEIVNTVNGCLRLTTQFLPQLF